MVVREGGSVMKSVSYCWFCASSASEWSHELNVSQPLAFVLLGLASSALTITMQGSSCCISFFILNLLLSGLCILKIYSYSFIYLKGRAMKRVGGRRERRERRGRDRSYNIWFTSVIDLNSQSGQSQGLGTPS